MIRGFNGNDVDIDQQRAFRLWHEERATKKKKKKKKLPAWQQVEKGTP